MSENTCLEKQPLSQEMLDKIDAYWRAATICQPVSFIFWIIR
ncbi:hypothetical protein [Roseburia sp. AM59-24XD]|nr:hypothetical protein [Roseburia sp. AM59-24XD]